MSTAKTLSPMTAAQSLNRKSQHGPEPRQPFGVLYSVATGQRFRGATADEARTVRMGRTLEVEGVRCSVELQGPHA